MRHGKVSGEERGSKEIQLMFSLIFTCHFNLLYFPNVLAECRVIALFIYGEISRALHLVVLIKCLQI